jgi:hypothetical protein
MEAKKNTFFKIELEDGSRNDYIFYPNGKIEHHYGDAGKIRQITPVEIDDATLQLLLEKCPYEFKARLKEILKRD